ncbi:hypothetical protein HYY73_04480 [Candidatus Woesearchaeota archaeon]|nr:hypothetical protein [Candidatus Woesearchaeota archaeon]
MPIAHSSFFLLNLALTAAVVVIDRRRIRDYFFLWLLGLAAAFVFETATTALGFWNYHSEPKVFLISLYTWLLYVPYLSFCYFVGNVVSNVVGKKFSSKVRKNG